MTGLSVLYANQAMKDRGWGDVPDRLNGRWRFLVYVIAPPRMGSL